MYHTIPTVNIFTEEIYACLHRGVVITCQQHVLIGSFTTVNHFTHTRKQRAFYPETHRKHMKMQCSVYSEYVQNFILLQNLKKTLSPTISN